VQCHETVLNLLVIAGERCEDYGRLDDKRSDVDEMLEDRVDFRAGILTGGNEHRL